MNMKLRNGKIMDLKRNCKRKIIVLFLLCYLLLFTRINSATACSIITTTSNEAVWFGYNEDGDLERFDEITKIDFRTSTVDSFAYMMVTAEKPNFFSDRVGMNAKGVAISGNGLPQTDMNPHPEKKYSWQDYSFYRLILEKSENISDAINIIKNFDFGSSMAYQLHIADANGNAIVMSPGADGEVAITEKQNTYMISTNTNSVAIENGSYDSRYEMAISVLEKEKNVGKALMKSVLNTIHYENYEGCTYYTSIFDLTNGIAYFYLLHDFDQEVSLNLTQELLLGDHKYLLMDLFPNGGKILEEAKERMLQQQTLVLISRLLVLILSILIICHLVFQIQRVRKSSNIKSSKPIMILKSSGTHIFGVIFAIITMGLFEIVFFTNIFERMIRSGIIRLDTILNLLIWIIGLLLFGYKLILIIIRNLNSQKIVF